MLLRRLRRRSGFRRLGLETKVQVVANATGILKYGASRLEREFLIYKLRNKLSCKLFIEDLPPIDHIPASSRVFLPGRSNGMSQETPKLTPVIFIDTRYIYLYSPFIGVRLLTACISDPFSHSSFQSGPKAWDTTNQSGRSVRRHPSDGP